jgi:hypothetical protein
MCLTLTGTFLDAKIGKQTARYVIQADKKLEKAEAAALDLNADKAISQIFKGWRLQANAFLKIWDLDFSKVF